MPSYVVTGVSRGIGWAFLKQLSSDSTNTVIGIVRNKPATDKRVAEELTERSNITILQADMTDYDAIKKAAQDSAKITGGSIDYIIANAALVSQWDAYDGIGTLGAHPEELTEQFHGLMDTNVLGTVHLYNLFMPQILKGKTRKVIVISSGMADTDLVNDYEIELAPLYATSKAAVNMITAKYNAQYKKDGVLFLSICPGMVEVGHFSHISTAKPEEQAALLGMIEKFKRYEPTFEGPITPEESVKAVLSVIESASVEKGYGGAYLSHFGTKRWI
ncbi:NAD(P)-binding protein [Lentithecium fluviatile CBS 122367]|uniref:NAD(P)-binding protein n=1 Tax=Lentithecium fluviatile CBS 122367 TaxID=1168545 RepID=A0A6G1IVP6_9PLEO|nr:NAD(P)-binding protein [Lentithecium fluviatile CBS 122367]